MNIESIEQKLERNGYWIDKLESSGDDICICYDYMVFPIHFKSWNEVEEWIDSMDGFFEGEGNMEEKIVVSDKFGHSWEMTHEQIEATYRYREHEYRKMDALNMINERLEWVDKNKDAFKREYGVSYDDTMKDLDDLVDEFMDMFDCNVPENEIWDEVLGGYFGHNVEEKEDDNDG